MDNKINVSTSIPNGKYYVAIKRVTTHIQELQDSGNIEDAKELTYSNLLPLVEKFIEVTGK